MAGAVRRRIILKTVGIATVIGLLFIIAGQLLMQLFKFSSTSLTIPGGLILLIFAIKMVLAEDHKHGHETFDDRAAEKMAIYPFAIPLLISPMGIVALTVFSANPDVTDSQVTSVFVAFLITMFINLVALFLSKVS